MCHCGNHFIHINMCSNEGGGFLLMRKGLYVTASVTLTDDNYHHCEEVGGSFLL